MSMVEFLETKPVPTLKAAELILQRLQEIGVEEDLVESFQQVVSTLQKNEILLSRRDLTHTKEEVIQDVDKNLSTVVESMESLAEVVVPDVDRPAKKKRKIV